jgi:hypothetical protein
MVKNTKGGSSHKKLARKKEDEAKIVKVNLDVNFNEDIIVLIDKNIGNCFTSKLMHYTGPSKDLNNKELKVLHQRGRNARSIFNKTQSRLALVSLVTDFNIQGCIGYVEELLGMDHLHAYLREKKITQDDFNKLSQYMTANVDDVKAEADESGFIFDRSNLEATNLDEESEIDLDTI